MLEEVCEEGGRFALTDSFHYFFSYVYIVKVLEVKLAFMYFIKGLVVKTNGECLQLLWFVEDEVEQ